MTAFLLHMLEEFIVGTILSFSKKLGKGKIDMTIGSALDLFGGTLSYERLAAMHF